MLEGMEGVSTFASDVDRAFWVVNIITLCLFVVTIGTMLYFVYRYRRSKNPPENTQNIEHYTPIEIAWTVIPTILMGIIFYYGLDSLRMQRTMPTGINTIQVEVEAKRWSWTFKYPNGKRSSELYVPVNRNIKLNMTAPANDVLHSFYVAAFRTKEDIVPGKTTYLWFNATKKGKFDIQCAEYCGTRHAYMLSFVNVVSEAEYEAWLNPKEVLFKPKGLEIMENNGCISCHSLDGSTLVGPTFKDIFNKEVSFTTGSEKRKVLRTDAYLRDAILNPDKDIVDGYYQGIMPAYKGLINDEDLNFVIKYLKGEIEKPKATKIDGKALVENNGCLGCHSIDGSKNVGSSFKNIYQRKVRISNNGNIKDILSEEQYLKTAIIKPNAEIVDGYYPGIMPSFEDILNEKEVDAIVDYLKTIK
jgi:cytochrome c oxidase subunit II